MHPFQAVLLVLVMGAVICAVWMSVRSSIEERRSRKGGNGPKAASSCDSEDCAHAWRQWDSGTCTTGYSSYGGPDPQEEWVVEYCPLCGAKVFRCTGSCDCRSECAATYEGGSR